MCQAVFEVLGIDKTEYVYPDGTLESEGCVGEWARTIDTQACEDSFTWGAGALHSVRRWVDGWTDG